MAQRKVHINPITERVGECRAKNCPFGPDTPHFESQQEAQAFLEEKYAQEHSRPEVVDSLKEMDANALSAALLQQVRDAGWDEALYERAIEFASVLHYGQKRQNRGKHNTTPYIEHPLRVANRLMKLGVRDEATIRAAILHDTVEDGTKRFFANVLEMDAPANELVARQRLSEYITAHYGADASHIVVAVSNDVVDASQWASATNAERFAVYHAHLKEAITDDPQVMMVKLGDFIDNATGLYHNDVPGFEAKIVKMAAKYRPCADDFTTEINKNLMGLDQKVVDQLLGQMDNTRVRLDDITTRYGHLLKP